MKFCKFFMINESQLKSGIYVNFFTLCEYSAMINVSIQHCNKLCDGNQSKAHLVPNNIWSILQKQYFGCYYDIVILGRATHPFEVVFGRPSGIKICQNKHVDLPTVTTPCD